MNIQQMMKQAQALQAKMTKAQEELKGKEVIGSSGGGKVKVRNSVFLANVLNGVYVTAYDSSAAGNDLSQIDLGSVSDPGRNVLQAAVGSMPDLAGLCIGMSAGRGPLTLSARGNVFAGPTDCTTSTAAIVRSTVCGGFVDLGVVPALGTTVTVDVGNCQ